MSSSVAERDAVMRIPFADLKWQALFSSWPTGTRVEVLDPGCPPLEEFAAPAWSSVVVARPADGAASLDAGLSAAGVRPSFELLVISHETLVSGVLDLARWSPAVVLVRERAAAWPDGIGPRLRKRAEELGSLGYRPYFADSHAAIYLNARHAAAEAGAIRPGFPRVTVGVPTRNGIRTLGRALDSIAHQRFANIRVLVSDNGSTDDTGALIEAFAERLPGLEVVIQPKPLRVWGHFLDLLFRAETEYFVWLADDDWWEPSFLEACVEALDTKPGATTAFSYFRAYYHWLDRYSALWKVAPSTARDPVVNVRSRVHNMAPNAVYGVHRTVALRRAADDLPRILGVARDHHFDFQDVAMTLSLATYGQMVIVPRDLYRGGYADASKVVRRSYESGREIAYGEFLRAIWGLRQQAFGLPVAVREMPLSLFEVYRVRRVHQRPAPYAMPVLFSRDAIERDPAAAL